MTRFLIALCLLGCDRISVNCEPSSETTRVFEACVRNVAQHSTTGDGDIEDVATDCALAAKRATPCNYVAGIRGEGRKWMPCSMAREPRDLELCAPYLREKQEIPPIN